MKSENPYVFHGPEAKLQMFSRITITQKASRELRSQVRHSMSLRCLHCILFHCILNMMLTA